VTGAKLAQDSRVGGHKPTTDLLLHREVFEVPLAKSLDAKRP